MDLGQVRKHTKENIEMIIAARVGILTFTINRPTCLTYKLVSNDYN